MSHTIRMIMVSAYTEEEMNEFLKKQIPDAKEIRINR